MSEIIADLCNSLNVNDLYDRLNIDETWFPQNYNS